jgi:ketosteroid isomerase-like protein
MSREENLEKTRAGYEAFARGDAQAALENIADDVEWIVPGQSAIGGSYRGKDEIVALWRRLGERSFSAVPEYWFADDERVCVLSHVTMDGGEMDVADLFTFREGKIVKYQTAGDTALMERLFPRG